MSERHGHAQSNDGSRRASRTYESWCGMKKRCLNSKSRNFKNYGARGITVCPQWMDFEVFLRDMGECKDGMQLDRIDNERGYEPGNCRWVTPAENSRNTRRTLLTADLVKRIVGMQDARANNRQISEALEVSIKAVQGVTSGRTWRDVVSHYKQQEGA